MEKILTTSSEEFSGFLKGSPNPAPSEFDKRQAYHYMAVSFSLCSSSSPLAVADT